MRLGTEDRKKLPILGVAGVCALGAAYYMYSQLSTPNVVVPAPVAVVPVAMKPVSGSGSRTQGKPAATAATAAQLDPTLHMEAMLVTESVVYTGSGRNIFSAGPIATNVVAGVRPQIVIPQPITPVRPQQTIAIGPPPIDLKFFGTEMAASGTRRAFLLHGDDVFLVATGEIVQRRYRIVRIEARSIVMEDIANNNQQTLPLLTN